MEQTLQAAALAHAIGIMIAHNIEFSISCTRIDDKTFNYSFSLEEGVPTEIISDAIEAIITGNPTANTFLNGRKLQRRNQKFD